MAVRRSADEDQQLWSNIVGRLRRTHGDWACIFSPVAQHLPDVARARIVSIEDPLTGKGSDHHFDPYFLLVLGEGFTEAWYSSRSRSRTTSGLRSRTSIARPGSLADCLRFALGGRKPVRLGRD